jgi:hypothetical protein
MTVRALFAAILFFAVTTQGATLEVNQASGCSDTTGKGTSAKPYCTIDKAILAAANGDTIHIATGSYSGPTGHVSKPLTFIGSGFEASGTVITTPMTYTGAGPLSMSNLRMAFPSFQTPACLRISGLGNFSGLTLSEVSFDTVFIDGVSIQQLGSVSNVTVKNCTFLGKDNKGLLIERGSPEAAAWIVDNVAVTGSTFLNNVSGIRIDPHVTNLHVSSSNFAPSSIVPVGGRIPQGTGLLLRSAQGATLDSLTIAGKEVGIVLATASGSTDKISSITLTNVTVDRSGSGMILEGKGDSISGVTVTGSTFSSNRKDGVSMSGNVSQISIQSSTIVGNGGNGVATNGAVSQVSIQCSTIAGNGRDGVAEGSLPSAALNAERVYWGCPGGPGTTGCSTVSGNVATFPYRDVPNAPCTARVTSITVTPPSVRIITTVTPVSVTFRLAATATLSQGSPGDVTTQATWSSSNTAVATVTANGTVTVVASGVATITGSEDGFSGTATITASVGDALPPDPGP